ncbi:hypothetical protein [Agrococcus lahaulensis]|uniref:hypothetical protein n=1 Tax=Agrococcus lahaulensis TaxID=341722 RepID=UPI0012EBE759|nr:hypothetical protein [Agrococcus lahaulensis]
MKSIDYYEALAAQAERGELVSIGEVHRGEQSREATRQMLLTASGVASVEELLSGVRRGRRRLDDSETSTDTWKVKAPSRLTQIVDDHAHGLGKNRSEFVRDAVAYYLAALDEGPVSQQGRVHHSARR